MFISNVKYVHIYIPCSYFIIVPHNVFEDIFLQLQLQSTHTHTVNLSRADPFKINNLL